MESKCYIKGDLIPIIKEEKIYGTFQQVELHDKKKAINVDEEKKPIQQDNVYLGIKCKIEESQRELAKKNSTMKSSFGNLDTLINSAKDLKEISDYIKTNKKIYDEQQNTSQIDKLLNDLGYFNLITKDDAGTKFYDEIAKQIYDICNQLFQKVGGIISLLDIYYIYNRKRSTCLISCEDLILACNRFKALGLGAQLQVYENNVKVLESTSFNQQQDYEQNIGKHLSYEQGITAEDLARKLGISILIAKIKLKKAVDQGKVVIDDRIEGMRYYKNLILDKML